MWRGVDDFAVVHLDMATSWRQAASDAGRLKARPTISSSLGFGLVPSVPANSQRPYPNSGLIVARITAYCHKDPDVFWTCIMGFWGTPHGRSRHLSPVRSEVHRVVSNSAWGDQPSHVAGHGRMLVTGSRRCARHGGPPSDACDDEGRSKTSLRPVWVRHRSFWCRQCTIAVDDVQSRRLYRMGAFPDPFCDQLAFGCFKTGRGGFNAEGNFQVALADILGRSPQWGSSNGTKARYRIWRRYIGGRSCPVRPGPQ
jgi:hypothetical protein